VEVLKPQRKIVLCDESNCGSTECTVTQTRNMPSCSNIIEVSSSDSSGLTEFKGSHSNPSIKIVSLKDEERIDGGFKLRVKVKEWHLGSHGKHYVWFWDGKPLGNIGSLDPIKVDLGCVEPGWHKLKVQLSKRDRLIRAADCVRLFVDRESTVDKCRSKHEIHRLKCILGGADQIPPNASCGWGIAKLLLCGRKLKYKIEAVDLVSEPSWLGLFWGTRGCNGSLISKLNDLKKCGCRFASKGCITVQKEVAEALIHNSTHLIVGTMLYCHGEIRGQVDRDLRCV